MKLFKLFLLACFALVSLTGCQSAYYDAMETAGYHKRDIMVSRVEDAKESQEEAQQQFASALDQLTELIGYDGGDLQSQYEAIKSQYEASESSASRVSSRIDSIEDVADALFEEWQEELTQYSSENLRRQSEKKLKDTERRYSQLIRSMRRAEERMQPVLTALKDNMLYLKHNLNAQAIGALQGEYANIKADVEQLINEMNKAIAQSQEFIDLLNN